MRADFEFRRHWHWLLLGGLVLYFCLETLMIRGSFIFVPGERDPRVVGRWDGFWTFEEIKEPRTLVFAADGVWSDGERSMIGPRRSTWGTKDGRLHVKWLATDHWVGRAFPYSLSRDGKTLRLETENRFGYLFPRTLRRVEAGSQSRQSTTDRIVLPTPRISQ